MSEAKETFFNEFKNLVIKHFSAEKPATEQKFSEAKLQDGTIVSYEGEVPVIGQPLMVVTPDGMQLPAPDGIHTLEDGTQIEIVGGLITAIVPATVAHAPDATAPVAPEAMSEDAPINSATAKRIIESTIREQVFSKVEAMEQAIAALTDHIAAVKAENDELKAVNQKFSAYVNDLTELVNKIGEQPSEPVEQKPAAFKAEKKSFDINEWRNNIWKK